MCSLTTTSPSPVASPRPTFYVPDPHRSRYSSSPSPSRSAYSSSTHSPRVPFTRPSPRHFAATSSPGSHTTNARGASNLTAASPQQRKEQPEGVTGSAHARPQSVDAGTQYSPEGFPPTAFRRDRKRKQVTRSLPSSASFTDSMAASAVASQAPPEPAQKPAQDNNLSQAAVNASSVEPQEARSTAYGATKRQKAGPGEVKIMPRAYENCDPKDLGILISNMLMELIRLNDQIPLRDGRLTRFHSRAPPGISVVDYLQRLIQHATLSPPILLSMVYYIDRLCQLYSAFTINSLTVHRFLITAATVAAKGLSDSFWTNPTYARIGGIPVSELATLELEFLQKVQWKIVPKPETLVDYYNSLVDRTEGFELEAGPSDTELSDASPEVGDVTESGL